ncbi:Sister chromatid cohesion protein 2 [Vermiconidia calcicola]|uniref:Sister chromatid cohesion protein 2 n=1 Tax=Vermiconidia calcicola TaxID=1690605 RepID=A0ACC3MKE2_9PEZI|nr:Sister chromatid cohesion protein 2 [Vermiconidia calcicola]
MDGYRQANGGMRHDYGATGSTSSKRQRMPTVHEALPYTPLSSIIPFTPDIIPPPLALPTTSASAFASSADIQNANRILEQLSAGATSAESASKRCQQTLQDVRRLLDPNSLTSYTFKRMRPSHTNNGVDKGRKTQPLGLSRFAKMVFENTQIPYRYLTPESPEPEPKTVASRPLLPSSAQHNGHTETPPSQHRKVQAVVPSSLTPAQRAQYQYVPDTNTLAGAQYVTPSNRSNPPITDASRLLNVDQQQKGGIAVQNLQNCLQEIFEAEDGLEPDSADALPANAKSLFATRNIGDGSVAVLQPEVQSKLEGCVYKAASCGRLQDIEVEHLTRLQKLCEVPIAAFETLSLRLGEDWSEQNVDEWLLRMGTVESGVVAARTLIRIMIGCASQKELQSEDALRGVLETLNAVTEGCLVPIVQERALLRERLRGEKGDPPANPKFVIASSHRKAIVSLLNAATKSLRLLGDLLVKTDFDETAISKVETLCKTLIFAENANTEKDSSTGIQNFETMRRCAMDVLAKIFTKYTEQRQYIFDEILHSLEKLPATKQSARQYRLSDGKPIQLVSALLMRLVQTSATRSNEALKLRSKVKNEESDGDDEDSNESDESSDEEDIKVSPTKATGNNNDLVSLISPLHAAAEHNAKYIVHVLVTRALSTSKSSEEPYRKLLDIFTEDFLNCLGSSDWPAAELLLRALVLRMMGIVEETNPVPSRTFALELLGAMGSGILELQMVARDAARSIDAAESPLASRLRDMVTQLETGNLDVRDVLAFDGPYRVVIEYLEERSTGEDPQLKTARGYHLMQWASSIVSGREGSADSVSNDTPRSTESIQAKLKHMLLDPQWLDQHGGVDKLSTSSGRLAGMILTLNLPFCKAFNKLFSILLTSMSSEQSTSTVKSRSLKSVVTLLEKDATILERNSYVLSHILRCATDTSPLVRDSALGLIDKCMSLQPALSATVYRQIIARSHDAAIGVRKRAMKMLKEIYLRNNSTTIRSAIANAIIARIGDTEESVVELARITMEEIWFQPLYGVKLDREHAVQAKLAYGAQVALVIETVERSDDVAQVLEPLLRRLLTESKAKAADANALVCRTLVVILFDGIIDNSDIPGSPSQDGILRSLTIFARASPKLFTPTQLERLEPYTQNLSTSDDLDIYRSVITILRYVLPHQATMNQAFLGNMQLTLLRSITRLQKTELNEVAPCLWTISTIINDTQRLATTMISVLLQIFNVRNDDLAADEQKALKIIRLVRIAGEFGNACDFEDFLPDFKKKLSWYNGDSASGLIVEILCSFTSPKRPLAVRTAALEAICTVSQAWPKQFMRADVSNAFETVFKDRVPSLEEVLCGGLEGFFKAQESPEAADDAMEAEGGIATGTERLGRTYVATDKDGASVAMAQRFLPDILRLALSSCDETAFSAARLVVSINKQGLVHPKESGPALVALETCPNKAIASEAFKEHKSQHEKHESLFEKEYMRAVQRTFDYQQQVLGSPFGSFGQPPTSKMHLTWEVLKIAKAGVRKKFLSNMVQKLDFDPSRLDTVSAAPQQLMFVRFCLENLAFFEYDRIDDLLQLLTSLEKLFAGTGSSVAQAIESEVLRLDVDGLMGSAAVVNGTSETLQPDPAPAPATPDVEPKRLRQLAFSSQILTLLWETRTFLVRLWNMQKHMKATKKEKDTNKAPTRATNAPTFTEAYLKNIGDVSSALVDWDSQRSMCSAFAELISVDSEVKVGSEEDADAELANGYDTPSESTSRKSPSLPPSGGGRGRKRKSIGASNTPRKRGRPSMGKKKSTATGKHAEDDNGDDGWD